MKIPKRITAAVIAVSNLAAPLADASATPVGGEEYSQLQPDQQGPLTEAQIRTLVNTRIASAVAHAEQNPLGWNLIRHYIRDHLRRSDKYVERQAGRSELGITTTRIIEYAQGEARRYIDDKKPEWERDGWPTVAELESMLHRDVARLAGERLALPASAASYANWARSDTTRAAALHRRLAATPTGRGLGPGANLATHLARRFSNSSTAQQTFDDTGTMLGLSPAVLRLIPADRSASTNLTDGGEYAIKDEQGREWSLRIATQEQASSGLHKG